MRDTYSLYEAKARLSALVRRVREGKRVVITLHGEPVAELAPVAPRGTGLPDRLDRLAERGIVQRRTSSTLPSIAKRPGALTRFLDERD